MNNNNAKFIGTVVSPFEYSHSMYDEKFYTVYVSSNRTSGVADIMPVLVSNRVYSKKEDLQGVRVEITGSFRSHNKHFNGKSHLILYLFADTFTQTEKEVDENSIKLNAFLCKIPSYRETPFLRKISDVILAVNRNCGKSDYLPAIAWSRNAAYMSTLKAGDHVLIKGRIQSRYYMKKIKENDYEERIAYEVSIQFIDLLDTGGESYEGDREPEVL
ncbi:MAG: Single-stranded DNA-binding protein [Lachnospiraceae bacterium]|jgi:hypothetical protein|nr:Single-stranded DNA-binding protein [Lachnospiraceae bacterium]